MECARLLLFYNIKDEEFGTNLNASDRDGHTPLHHAVYGGHINMVRLLLMNGASVNAFDKNDRRAMHWASACNLTGIIDLLCEFGAEVNCRDRLQYTPLHVAAALGNMSVFIRLIELGADLDARTQRYNSILHLGCLNGQIEVVKKCLSILAEECQGSVTDSSLILALNQRNLDGYVPLHLAAMSSNDGECLEFLISFYKNFLETDGRESSKSLLNLELTAGEGGWTPLHLAAIYGRHRQAQTLLKNSANVNSIDNRGFTPLHMAARQGHQLVLCTLLDAGALWNARAHQDGITPLHCATISGFSVCFNRLLDIAKRSWDEAREETVSISETEHLKTYSSTYTAALQSFRDDLGRSLVHTSALGGSVDCFRTLLLSGASPFDLDAMGRTPLHYALLSNRLKGYLEEPQTRVSTKSTPVAEIVRVLLKLGVDPNHRDVHGCTALHLASAFDTEGSLIRALLLYGANKNAVLSRSPTKIYPNEDNDSCSSASFSVSESSQPSHTVTKNCMVLRGGIHNGQFSSHALSSTTSEEQLCIQNAILTPLSIPFQTVVHVMAAYYPLHIAAAMGNVVGVKIFVQDLSTRESCLLILDSAKMTRYVPKNPDCIAAFEGSILKAKTETSSHFFYSPLFLAAFRGHTDCVKVLMNSCKSRSYSERDEMLTEEGEDDFKITIDANIAVKDQKKFNVEEKKENGRNSEVNAALQEGGRRLSFFHHPPLSDARPCGKLTDPLGRTLLHYAAYAGRLETCQFLIAYSLCQADPTLLDGVYGWTAVHYAASQGHSSVVGFLLRYSAKENPSLDLVNARDREGRTALMLAAENMHTSVIELLCSLSLLPSRPVSVYDHSCDPHIVRRVTIVDKHGRTALHRSSALGHAEAAKILLQTGASLTLADENSRQALHFASISGSIEVLDVLLQTVDNLIGLHEAENTRVLIPLDYRGFTPLHYAVQGGHLTCIERLLKVESYKSLVGNTYTPLHCAAMFENVSIIRTLLAAFPVSMLKLKDARGSTPLHIAAMANLAKVVQTILLQNLGQERDAISCLDNKGRTPLMAAALHGAAKTVDFLLLYQRNLEDDPILSIGRRDLEGSNVLHLALFGPNEDTALCLIRRSDFQELINEVLADGRTPLHLAAEKGFTRTVIELIKRGANSFVTDKTGKLPICGIVKSMQYSECQLALLLDMLPQLANTIEAPQQSTFVSRRTSHNLMADSIRSSDPEFY
ncbi:unnamed protein product [Rodentolepis nana]|uniref:Uncharacterized protein n=1 Tax=Rodentolepis nana TaxID=102285 RepID=A0A3P7SLE0_RODNA|nr:unnamed protein product [Rodentolepis nana]